VRKGKPPQWPKISRDVVLFVSGLALIINEATRSGPERPYLLMLFAGMIGLPVFLRTDERRQQQRDRQPDPEGKP
jgi:hypothetical protein